MDEKASLLIQQELLRANKWFVYGFSVSENLVTLSLKKFERDSKYSLWNLNNLTDAMLSMVTFCFLKQNHVQ